MSNGFKTHIVPIIDDNHKTKDTTYSSEKIEQLLQQGGGGTVGPETDPTVPQWVKNISEQDIANWNQGSLNEPMDDNKLYFRTRTPGSQIGQWKVFDYVDGTIQKVTINSKDSTTEGNYVPALNELVYDNDRDIIVKGDGVSTLETLRPFYETTITGQDVINALGFTPENVMNKGISGGYVPLGSDGKIASIYLPPALTDNYSKSDVDNLLSNLQNTLTTLINQEASTARSAESGIDQDLQDHISNTTSHITQQEKDDWNAKLDSDDIIDLQNHVANQDIHVTQQEKDKWNGADVSYFANSKEELPKDDSVQIGNRGYVRTSQPDVEPVTLETYLFNGTDWIQTEFGELALSIDWVNIINKPNSQVTEIDNAVRKAHIHTNKNVLDNLGQTIDGNLIFNGKEVGSVVVFLKTDELLPQVGKSGILYVVYNDSRLYGHTTLSTYNDGAYTILGREGDGQQPPVVGDMQILQENYLSVEANTVKKIQLTGNDSFIFLPLEILKEAGGKEDVVDVIIDFTDETMFDYDNMLFDIGSSHLVARLLPIPLTQDKVDTDFYSSVDIDISKYKEIEYIG